MKSVITFAALLVTVLMVAPSLTAEAQEKKGVRKMQIGCNAANSGSPECRRWYKTGKQPIVLSGVNFESGSARLTPQAKLSLDRSISAVRSSHGTIKIVGFTDDQGSVSSNVRLSQRRANAVKNYFESKGLMDQYMRSIGEGEADPVATNETSEGRAKNRRIEIYLR